MTAQLDEQSDIAALLELEKVRCERTSDGDIDGLRALLTDDYEHVHATARHTDRDETLSFVRDRPRRIEPRTPDVRLYGDVAVLTGDMTNLIGDSAEQRTVRLRVTQVARRTADGWQFCSFHSTPYPNQQLPGR